MTSLGGSQCALFCPAAMLPDVSALPEPRPESSSFSLYYLPNRGVLESIYQHLFTTPISRCAPHMRSDALLVPYKCQLGLDSQLRLACNQHRSICTLLDTFIGSILRHVRLILPFTVISPRHTSASAGTLHVMPH
ncbi:hypothetical protein DENSPDRAFT_499382 [Dentipellis sp. KUC8613]|nr:hypothetical protein DENSPDRAFT_499382 [Dentipellis sp. KUC8613]